MKKIQKVSGFDLVDVAEEGDTIRFSFGKGKYIEVSFLGDSLELRGMNNSHIGSGALKISPRVANAIGVEIQ